MKLTRKQLRKIIAESVSEEMNEARIASLSDLHRSIDVIQLGAEDILDRLSTQIGGIMSLSGDQRTRIVEDLSQAIVSALGRSLGSGVSRYTQRRQDRESRDATVRNRMLGLD